MMHPMMWDDTYFIYLIIALAVPGLAQLLLMSTFNKYKNVKSSSGMTGAEVARRLLDANGLSNLHVGESPGNLTDHYDPKRRIVKLSHDIYHGRSVAAAAVAAHEVGHAIQHKENYSPLALRSALVPLANIGSRLGYVAIFLGFFLEAFQLATLGILLIGFIVLFQLVTLPVEFNASSRAMRLMTDMNIVYDNTPERRGARKVLTAAAWTYVASLIVAIAQVLRLVIMVSRRNNRR